MSLRLFKLRSTSVSEMERSTCSFIALFKINASLLLTVAPRSIELLLHSLSTLQAQSHGPLELARLTTLQGSSLLLATYAKRYALYRRQEEELQAAQHPQNSETHHLLPQRLALQRITLIGSACNDVVGGSLIHLCSCASPTNSRASL